MSKVISARARDNGVNSVHRSVLRGHGVTTAMLIGRTGTGNRPSRLITYRPICRSWRYHRPTISLTPSLSLVLPQLGALRLGLVLFISEIMMNSLLHIAETSSRKVGRIDTFTARLPFPTISSAFTLYICTLRVTRVHRHWPIQHTISSQSLRIRSNA